MVLNNFVALDGSNKTVPTPPNVIGVLTVVKNGGIIATLIRDVAKDDTEYPDAVVQWMYTRGFMPDVEQEVP